MDKLEAVQSKVVELSSRVDRNDSARRRVDRFGGGGDDGSMDDRLRSLETSVARMDERMIAIGEKIDGLRDDTKASADRIAARVDQHKWQLAAAVVAVALAVWGSSIAIQQMTVAAFQGAAQLAQQPAVTTTAHPATQAAPAK